MKRPALLLALMVPVLLSAQKNFRQGYIVGLNGDTTTGYIDHKEWNLSPNSILFKSSLNAENHIQYGVNNVQYFEILKNEAYLRAIVPISLDPVSINRISVKDTSAKTDTVFLKVIQAGNMMSLFSYTDETKKRFFMLEAGNQQPVELIYRQYFARDNTTRLITEDTYKNQLQALMIAKNLSSNKIGIKLASSGYNEKSLKQIAMLINSVNERNDELHYNKKSGIVFFAGAGVQQNNIKFTGNHFFANNSTSKSSLLPKISAGLDLMMNPNVGKLLFRSELGFQANKSTISGSRASNLKSDYEIAFTTLSLFPQLIYNLYNADQVKVPVGVGIGYNLTSYSKNAYKEFNTNSGTQVNSNDNYFELEKGYLSFLVRAGVTLNKKLDASIIYHPSASLTRYGGYSIANSNLQLELYYRFNRNK